MTNKTAMTLLALAAWLPAQAEPNATTKIDARAALARAVVLQEREFDRAGAAAEYARIAADAAAPDEVRMEAKLRLGALKLLDGDEPAGRALLREVADSGSALAPRAQQILAQQQSAADDVTARVVRALGVFATKPADGAKELRFLGAPAAAPLAEQILTKPFDRGFLEEAVAVLLDLDDAVAAQTLATLRGRDAYVRRALAPSLRLVQRERTDAEVLRFLRDEDAEVRQWALRKLAVTAPTEALVASMTGAPETVRSAMLAEWAKQEATKGWSPSTSNRLAPLAAAELTRERPVASVWSYLWMMGSMTAAQPVVLLRALRHPDCVVPQELPPGFQPRAGVGDELVDEVLATAEVLKSTADADPRRRALNLLVGSIEKTWTGGALGKRARLAGLGYGRVRDWINQHATATDLPLVLDHLGDLGLANIGDYLDKQTVPPERWRAFADHTTRWRQRPAADAARSAEVQLAIYRLAATAHPEATAWLQQHAAEDMEGLEGAGYAFREAKPAQRLALAETCAQLLDRTLADGFAPDPRWPESRLRGWRDTMLATLVEADPTRAASRLPAACRAGAPYSLSGLLAQEVKSRRLSDEQLATTVAACLATNQPEAVRLLLQSSEVSRLTPAFAALCEGALQIDAQLRVPGDPRPAREPMVRVLQSWAWVSPSHADRLFAACMQQDSDALAAAAIDGRSANGPPLDTAASHALAARITRQPTARAVGLLAELGQPTDAETLVALLGHPDADVRAGTVRGLIRMRGETAVPTVLPLARDPAPQVRMAVCAAANKQLDRRFAPALVELLRDPDYNIRKQAQAALQATEFYVTQTERWQRLLTGTGIEATSAAEALIQQTKSNDQAVRLAAIRGLGALGVKEALPFLIQLMQDQDAEVKKAASEAAAVLSR